METTTNATDAERELQWQAERAEWAAALGREAVRRALPWPSRKMWRGEVFRLACELAAAHGLSPDAVCEAASAVADKTEFGR